MTSEHGVVIREKVAKTQLEGESEEESGDENERKRKFEKNEEDQKQSTFSFLDRFWFFYPPQSIPAIQRGNTRTSESEMKRLDKEKSTTKKEGKGDHDKLQSSSIKSRQMGLLYAAVAVVCIAAVIAHFARPKGDTKSNFGYEIDELQLSFTNQTDRLWKILKSRGLAHLQDKDPLQPLVFLLAAPPAAHEWVDCLAIKLAEKLDPLGQRPLVRIFGEKEKGNPPEITKKSMNNILQEKFEAGHRVVLIHHLELLPPPSSLLFYIYCDDQNAPHKNVAIIFTVHMPVEPSPSLSPKEAEESVEEYLSGDVWAEVDKDAVAGLLSRISDIVVLMNGESSGSAKELCSYSTY